MTGDTDPDAITLSEKGAKERESCMMKESFSFSRCHWILDVLNPQRVFPLVDVTGFWMS